MQEDLRADGVEELDDTGQKEFRGAQDMKADGWHMKVKAELVNRGKEWCNYPDNLGWKSLNEA